MADQTPADATASAALPAILEQAQPTPSEAAAPSSATPLEGSKANPASIRIGGVETPISIVEAQFEKARYADEQLESIGDAKDIHNLMLSLPEEANLLVVDYLAEIVERVKAGTPLSQAKRVSEFEAPVDYKPVATSDMDDAVATVAEMVWDLRQEIYRELRRTAQALDGVRRNVGSVVQLTEDEQLASRCSELLGRPFPLQELHLLRQNGIQDPLKAIPYLKAQGGPTAVGKAPEQAPAEAKSGGPEGGYDANDPKYAGNPILMRELWDQGIYPHDPLDREALGKFMGVQ